MKNKNSKFALQFQCSSFNLAGIPKKDKHFFLNSQLPSQYYLATAFIFINAESEKHTELKTINKTVKQDE